MAKTVEEQMISDAIAGTEKEIFAEATGTDEADTEVGAQGNRSLEEMGDGLEGQNEDAEENEESEETEVEETGEGLERDPKTGQFKPKAEGDDKSKLAAKSDADAGKVPPGRLREEADKRRTAEAASAAALAERDAALAKAAKLETDFGALNKRLDDLMTAIATGRVGQPQQQPAPKVEEEPVPDIFADPEGYQRYMRNQVERTAHAGQQQLEQLRVELSMQAAHDKYEGQFEEAYKAVTSLNKNDPVAQQTVRRIWSSPNPGKALMSWHNQVKTLSEVGEDPTKYREKVEKDTRDKLLNDPDFIKQVMEKMRGEAENAGGQGKPRVRFAPSLNAARGGGMGQLTDRRPQDGSDAGVFASAFED